MVKLIPREIREAIESACPDANPLSDEQYGQYTDSIRQFSGKAYDSLNVKRKGSNLWQVLHLNQIGIETATLSQLYDAHASGIDLSNKYADSRAVVLRSNGDNDYEPNDHVAKDLAGKLESPNFENPLVVEGLVPEADEESDYGLVLTPGNGFRVFEAPDFHDRNNNRRFWSINPDYSINWVGENKDPKGSIVGQD